MRVGVLALAMLMAIGGVSNAQTVPEGTGDAIKASDLPSPPVTAGDISDRSYKVLGEITAGVRKATVFSGAASEDKINRELWERGRKLGADAVIHASHGKSHVSAMSWGQTTATGIAIKFDAPAATGGGQ